MKRTLKDLLIPAIGFMLVACSNDQTSQSNDTITVDTDGTITLDSQNITRAYSTEQSQSNTTESTDLKYPENSSENAKLIYGMINQHISTYFFKQYVDRYSNGNSTVITSPLINTLPLFWIACAGETKAKIDENIPSYKIPESLKAINEYKWRAGTRINQNFLTEVFSSIQPSMGLFITDTNYPSNAVLHTKSTYQKKITFNDNNLSFNAIKGRYIDSDSAYEADMLQFNGKVLVQNTELYTAKQIELESRKSFLTLITPNKDDFYTVLGQISPVLNHLLADNNNWEPAPNSSFVIPATSISDKKHALEWANNIDTSLAFSETEANLARMGFGGFYFEDAMEGFQEIEISSDKISVHAESSLVISQSKNNNHYNGGAGMGVILTYVDYPVVITEISELKYLKPFEPDFKPSILLLHDNKGLIQVAAVIQKLDGTHIGFIGPK